MQCPRCNALLELLADPPDAGGFEFSLYGCPQCGHRQMFCFCVATGRSGTEAVTAEEAAIIMNTADRDQLKRFMKEWQSRVIG